MDKVLQGYTPVIPSDAISPTRDDGEVVRRFCITPPTRRISTPAAPIEPTPEGRRPLPQDDRRLDRPPGVSAAILIGGRSRRMGEPKAILRLEPDGPTLVEMVVTTLRQVAAEVFLVGEPDWPLPESLAGMRIVEDARQGAADGVIAALSGANHAVCLVAGCDMPFLDPSLLADMVAMAREHDRTALARDETGVHPLHAAWRRADLGQIEAVVASGQRSLTRIAAIIGAIEFDVAGKPWSMFNVNTPADLAVAREHADRLRSPEGEIHS